MKVIEFKNVWEKYRIKYIREGKVLWEEFWVLKDINFSVDRGEVVGIVGKNGAGKTTLLKLIGGMITPDKGEIIVRGKVSGLMELGAGFNPEFTGRENITLNAQIYGVFDKELKSRINKIIEFADLGKFIDAPLKYYSQGMYARLAFSLAIHVYPEILIIDDILAVGDEEFQRKCRKKIFNLKEEKKTVVVASHNMNMIENLCDRVLFLDEGVVECIDVPSKIVPMYLERVGNREGIGILRNGKLRVTFNNGKIFISYKGKSVTKNQGSWVVFFDKKGGMWIPSFNLQWKIIKKNETYILAEGYFENTSVKETWEIKLLDSELRFHIELNTFEVCEIKQLHWDLLLYPVYESYYVGGNYYSIPPYSSKLEWCKVTQIGEVVSIGVCSQADTENPYLVIDKEEKDEFMVFNTGYEEEARVFSIYSAENNIEFSIKLLEDKEAFEGYISSSNQAFITRVKHQKSLLLENQSLALGFLKLFVMPESKSIHLAYRDKEITKASGFDVSFRYKENFFNTFSSTRFTFRKENNVLFVDIIWEEAGLSQMWKLYFKDSHLYWDIEQRKISTYRVEDLRVGLIINSEYQRFFCGAEENLFPEPTTTWQDMELENVNSKFSGVMRTDNLPALIVENIEGGSFIIQNGDMLSKCRVVQLRLGDDLVNKERINVNLKMKILEDDNFIIQYISSQLQERKRSILQQRFLSAGSLNLFFDSNNKVIRLFYRDKEITKGCGLFTGVRLNSDYKVSFYDYKEWEVAKIDENTLELTARNKNMGVDKIFTFQIINENSISIKVELCSASEFYLADYYLKLEITESYKQWATCFEKGELSKEKCVGNIIPVRFKENKINEIVLEPREPIYPTLKISSFFNPLRKILTLHKRKEEKGEVVCLQYQFSLFDEEQRFAEGKHTIFEGTITIEDSSVKSPKELVHLEELVNKDLRFIFDRGKGKLFYKDMELTQDLGIYSSMRVEGIWYDSSQAIWRLEERKKNKLVFYGKWFLLPVYQRWWIEIMDNKICLRITTQIFGDIKPEIEQVNVMATKKYKEWTLSNGLGGEFNDFYPEDYDILPFRYCYLTLKHPRIRIKGKDLPSLTFTCNQEEEFRTLVENSDYFYSARLIQYQRLRKKELLSQYKFFEGEIVIEED